MAVEMEKAKEFKSNVLWTDLCTPLPLKPNVMVFGDGDFGR